jgi:hypothetical protein
LLEFELCAPVTDTDGACTTGFWFEFVVASIFWEINALFGLDPASMISSMVLGVVISNLGLTRKLDIKKYFVAANVSQLL